MCVKHHGIISFCHAPDACVIVHCKNWSKESYRHCCRQEVHRYRRYKHRCHHLHNRRTSCLKSTRSVFRAIYKWQIILWVQHRLWQKGLLICWNQLSVVNYFCSINDSAYFLPFVTDSLLSVYHVRHCPSSTMGTVADLMQEFFAMSLFSENFIIYIIRICSYSVSVNSCKFLSCQLLLRTIFQWWEKLSTTGQAHVLNILWNKGQSCIHLQCLTSPLKYDNYLINYSISKFLKVNYSSLKHYSFVKMKFWNWLYHHCFRSYFSSF